MPSSTLLNDLLSKANPDNYCRETLALLREFIGRSCDLFELDKKTEQGDDEFDTLLLEAINEVLINFYPLHQRLFIELKFSSFQDIVNYYQGIQFHPCFDCFDWLLKIPMVMDGWSVDKKQQIILHKESIPYALLKKFYYEHRIKILKRIRDYERVEKKGYEKALKAYQLFKQKVITTQETSLNISTQALILELKSFTSFALVLSAIQCIYKVFNRWAKDTNTILIRKLVLNIEKASISINMIALGSGRFNDLIKMDLLSQSFKQIPKKNTIVCILTTRQKILSLNKTIQDKAQVLWELLEKLKQKQYADPRVAEIQHKAMGNLAQLTDSAALIRKAQQLNDLNSDKKIVQDYFALIQNPVLANLLTDLCRLLDKKGDEEKGICYELQRIFKNPYYRYHTCLPGLYSFQLVNKQALVKEHTEKGKRA